MIKKNYIAGILSIIFNIIMFNSCSITNKIYSENDIVYSTRRFELNYYAGRNWDRRSPLSYLNQFIVKEVNSKNEVKYTAYDVLHLSAYSFKLEDIVIFIIDNEPYNMLIDRIELENSRNISESRSDILSSDSVSISVITDYSESNSKIIKFIYKIPDPVIEKIKQSHEFCLRYYSGPNMITVKPRKKSIKMLKRLIDLT